MGYGALALLGCIRPQKAECESQRYFILHDPFNPLHAEFLEYHTAQGTLVSPSHPDFQRLCELSSQNTTKVIQKNNPTILALINGTYVKVKHLSKMAEYSVQDEKFALSKLDNMITQLFHTHEMCFVYTGNTYGLRFIQFEGPAIKIEKQLAKLLGIKEGNFYCYHRPSLTNSPLPLPSVTECLIKNKRDVFTLKRKYKNEIVSGQGIVDDLFDVAFDRTFNLEYLCGDFNQFKTIYLSERRQEEGDEDIRDRPVMLVASQPNGMFKKNVRQLIEYVSDMDIFDVYLADSDSDETKALFYFKHEPPVKPFVMILDKSEKPKMIKRHPFGSLEPDRDLGNYFDRKYIADEVWFGEGMEKSIDNFVDAFLDGTLKHNHYSQRRKSGGNVRQLTSDSFQSWLQDPKGSSQIVVEVGKEGCAACKYNGRIYDVLSLKYPQLPLYRMDISNKIPQLGRFGYSPLYILVRRNGDKVVEILTLPTPSTQKGLNIGRFSHILEKRFGVQIKIDVAKQMQAWFSIKDLDQSFDINFDI